MSLIQCEKYGQHGTKLVTDAVNNRVENNNFNPGEIVLWI